MLQEKTIGFIGSGHMSEALMRGLLNACLIKPERVICADVAPQRLEALSQQLRVRAAPDNGFAIKHADVVIFAVKPQVMHGVLQETADSLDTSKLIISVAAGIPLKAVTGLSDQPLRVIRAMPNVNAMVGESATAIAANEYVTREDFNLALTIFNAVGRCVAVHAEHLLDAVTGLSGSGPAYVFMIMEALADGGVKMGLSREQALQLSAQTLLGAAKMHLDSGTHPAQLKDMVTSPGGTTSAGLHALEKGGLRGTLMDAVERATQRATELGAACGK
ncbi:MAG: pyrroline-5-carboxylate reductase [Desulfatitalea sp.]|nr:pyrroline-5-carboxylate reductase [Desulfatitalea sp.]NNJ98914.1 pyrroline-5-carboxylate reductase [Desulfatitalea sp.]